MSAELLSTVAMATLRARSRYGKTNVLEKDAAKRERVYRKYLDRCEKGWQSLLISDQSLIREGCPRSAMKLRLDGRSNGSLLGSQKKIPLNTIVLPPLSPALRGSEVIGHVLVSSGKQRTIVLASAKIRKRDVRETPFPAKTTASMARKLNNQYFCVGV